MGLSGRVCRCSTRLSLCHCYHGCCHAGAVSWDAGALLELHPTLRLLMYRGEAGRNCWLVELLRRGSGVLSRLRDAVDDERWTAHLSLGWALRVCSVVSKVMDGVLMKELLIWRAQNVYWEELR